MAKIKVLIYHCEHGHESTYVVGQSTPTATCEGFVHGKPCGLPLVPGPDKRKRRGVEV